MKINWHDEPQKHDYPVAQLPDAPHGPTLAKKVAADLNDASMIEFSAKDIFRASRLSLLGASHSHVAADRTKIILKEKLSPLLLLASGRVGPLIIADGYDRLCAVYTFDEDAMIPCKIVYAASAPPPKSNA